MEDADKLDEIQEEKEPEQPKKKSVKVVTPVLLIDRIEHKYKLDLYNNRGLLKPSIPKAIFADMSRKYGDVIRSVSTSKWSTIEDIVEYYYILDKRLKFDIHRTPAEIELAVEELVGAGLILKK